MSEISVKEIITLTPLELKRFFNDTQSHLFRNELDLKNEDLFRGRSKNLEEQYDATVYFMNSETGRIEGASMLLSIFDVFYESDRDINQDLIISRNQAIKDIYYTWCYTRSIKPNRKEGWFKSKKFSLHLESIDYGGNYVISFMRPYQYEKPQSPEAILQT